MVEKEELPSNENDFSDDELVRELLDDKTPFLLLPATIESEPALEIKTKPALDRSFTKFYSGPTIGDIKTALTSTRQVLDSQEPQVSPPKVSLLEKGLERNKHTMKIKSTGNGLPEDGYKWRKYGQKLIKNSRNPRSYYRCTNPRCSAKKRVEISNEEPGTLAVTYEGLHLHFGYTHFNLNQPQTSPLQNPNKKREMAPPGPISQTLPGPTSQPALMAGWHQPPQPSTPNCLNTNGAALIEASGGSHQGLLEDIVPLPVRNH